MTLGLHTQNFVHLFGSCKVFNNLDFITLGRLLTKVFVYVYNNECNNVLVLLSVVG